MKAEDIEKEFLDFKAQVEAKFATFPFLNEKNLKRVLVESIRAEERVSLLRKIWISIIVLILLVIFIICLILFTEPI